MNRKQKACILVGMAVFVVMGLYPPWVVVAVVTAGLFIVFKDQKRSK